MIQIQSSDQQNKILNNDIINEYYDDHLNTEINYYNPNNHHYHHQNENFYPTKNNANSNNNNYASFNNFMANSNTNSNNTNQTNKINIVINKKQSQQNCQSQLQPQSQILSQPQQQPSPSQPTQLQNNYTNQTQQIVQPVTIKHIVQPEPPSQIQQQNQIIINNQHESITTKNNNSSTTNNTTTTTLTNTTSNTIATAIKNNNVNNNINIRLSKDLSHKILPPIRSIVSSDNLKEMNAKKFQNKNDKIKEFNSKLKQNMNKQHDQIKLPNSNYLDKPPPASNGPCGLVNQVKKKFEKLEKSSTANIIIPKSTSTTSTIHNKKNNNRSSNANVREKTNLNLKLKPPSSQPSSKPHHNHKIQTVTLSLDEKFSNHNNMNANSNNLIKANSHLVIKQTIESNTKLIKKSSKICTNKSNDKLCINAKKNPQPQGMNQNNKPIYSNNIKKHQINNCSQQQSNSCIYGRYYPNIQINNNHKRLSANDLENKDLKLTEMKSIEIKKVDNNRFIRPSANNLGNNEVLETQSKSTVVSQPNRPLFKPPNTEELMKPTIRGAPTGLLNKFGTSNEMLTLPNEFTVYNFQPKEAKKMNVLNEQSPNPTRKLLNNHTNYKSKNSKTNLKKQIKEQESNVVLNKISADNKPQKDALNTSMDPKSPDLEDFKIQPEKAFFNDNHFSFQNRTSKLIIREKQLKSPKSIKKEEPILSAINLSFNSLSSSSTFEIVEKNDFANNKNKKSNSNTNLINDEIVKAINSGSDRPISVELDLSVCYVNKNAKNTNSSGNNNDNKSNNKQPSKLEFKINFDKTFDIEKDLKTSMLIFVERKFLFDLYIIILLFSFQDYEAFNKNTFEEMITQPEKFSILDYEVISFLIFLFNLI